MQQISLRMGSAQDLPAVHDLVRELAIFEKAEDQFTADLSHYQDKFQQGLFQIILAESGSDIIGMALFYPSFSTWKGKMMYLEDFVVKESYRNQGVGQMLFDKFLGESLRQGARLAKWQVLDWNEHAIRFYRRNHATIQTEWYNGLIYFEEGTAL